MHYYEHNIKDYRADAFQLTLTQHGAYRQLIDQYCLNEKPLPLVLDDLFNDLLIRGEDEKAATIYVLGKFFNKTEDGYVHKRCELTVKKFQGKSTHGSKASNIRWAKEREKKANAETTSENTNIVIDKPLDVNQAIWQNYMELRDAKKKPVTNANIKALRREAANAGMNLNAVLSICVDRSWISFSADWIDKKKIQEEQTKEVWGK
jgi:uncharacterized protein YdaU (DUF1376 family)